MSGRMHLSRMLWRMIAIGLYIVADWSTKVCAERRNLSEIRYHFTPCGARGDLGPSYEQCLEYYASIASPITRDRVLTHTYSSFAGTQSFRPPRDTKWHVTVAGAAGGRGLCNVERGRGLVQRLESIPLSGERDLIILAGQTGLGPCETAYPDPGHKLCGNPPQTEEEANTCYSTFIQWVVSNVSQDNFIAVGAFNGGAGGGGGSYIGDWERPYTGIYDNIIGISGGGGGTSVALSYNVARDFRFEANRSALSDVELYKLYIDAKPNAHDNETRNTFGRRGYRIVLEDSVTAGAGGGFSESLTLPLSLEDGRGLNMSENFAEGGTHCSRSEEEVPEQLREAVGGFGAGGGGCLEGGGGGGFTGGAVVNFSAVTPGSGGYSFNSLSIDYEVLQYSYNEGDGYVDIVAADCGCVYECVVYEEEDEFECLCPNNTQLAPDLSDCYYSDDRNVTVTDIDTSDDFSLRGISFGNSSFIFSVDVHLTTAQPSVKRSSDVNEADRGGLCVLVFVGEDDSIVLVTEPVSGSGRATSLSRVSGNGTLSSSGFISFLDSSILITGAVLASTGQCIIEDVVTFDISTQEIDSNDEVNFTKIATELYNSSGSTNTLLRQLLQISEDGNNTEDDNETGPKLSNGVIAAIAISTLTAVLGFVAVTVLVFTLLKRHKSSSDTVNLTHMKTSVNPYSSEELQSNLGYEVLDFGDNDGVCESVPGTEQWTSKYGVTATSIDFTEFNRTRGNTLISDWEYERSNLIFMRDLGEGQFGKVMLMKALNIAGYAGTVPVAVKTLSSRDPSIIQKFMEEAELMKQFTHPNIVSLLGVCNMSVKDDSAPLMILEYMPYGDLRGFLEVHRPTQEHPKSQISEHHFYDFAMDVGHALEFLSSHKYVHRDIAARNCLVGANLQIKIADFGLARGIYDKDYYRVAGRTFLPVRWMAPECLLYGIFTTASDVWAYGVLLWEITSYGLTPLNEYEAQEIVNMAQEGTLQHMQPTACPEALYSVLCQCHQKSQEERPSFSDLLQLLETQDSSNRTKP